MWMRLEQRASTAYYFPRSEWAVYVMSYSIQQVIVDKLDAAMLEKGKDPLEVACSIFRDHNS